MSKWAEVDSKWYPEKHEVPIQVEKMPCKFLNTAAYGHVPFIDCHCKPEVSFSPCGEYVIVRHRDPERGATVNFGQDTLQ